MAEPTTTTILQPLPQGQGRGGTRTNPAPQTETQTETVQVNPIYKREVDKHITSIQLLDDEETALENTFLPSPEVTDWALTNRIDAEDAVYNQWGSKLNELAKSARGRGDFEAYTRFATEATNVQNRRIVSRATHNLDRYSQVKSAETDLLNKRRTLLNIRNQRDNHIDGLMQLGATPAGESGEGVKAFDAKVLPTFVHLFGNRVSTTSEDPNFGVWGVPGANPEGFDPVLNAAGNYSFISSMRSQISDTSTYQEVEALGNRLGVLPEVGMSEEQYIERVRAALTPINHYQVAAGPEYKAGVAGLQEAMNSMAVGDWTLMSKWVADARQRIANKQATTGAFSASDVGKALELKQKGKRVPPDMEALLDLQALQDLVSAVAPIVNSIAAGRASSAGTPAMTQNSAQQVANTEYALSQMEKAGFGGG